MVLDNNNVYPASGSKLNLKFGKWDLETKDWKMSTSEGGIVSENAIIRTALVDIPLEKFILRNDLFQMNAKQDLGKIPIGGGVSNVNVDKKVAHAVLQWDNKVGVDMAGHWRFSITSQTDAPAATTDPLTGIYKSTNLNQTVGLDITYLQILDNNDALYQLKMPPQPYKLNKNPLANYSPYSIFNGSNYLDVAGKFEIDGAPRVPDMSLEMNYKRNNGVQKMEFRDVTMSFAARGNVNFTAVKTADNDVNVAIDNTTISLWGYLAEKPTPTFNAMPARLTAKTNANPKYRIDVQDNWVTQLQDKTSEAPGKNAPRVVQGQTGYRLELTEGGMKVQGNDWSNFVFKGKMYDNMNPNDGLDPAKAPMTTFTVLGDVTADADNVAISGLNTPFGKLQTKFDFKKGELTGSLKINEPIPFPPTLYIDNGQIEFKGNQSGFYVMGAFKTNVTIPVIQGQYNLGFMIGHYPVESEMKSIIWPYVNNFKNPKLRNTCYRDYINSKLSGFYFTIDRDLFNLNLNYNFIVAYGKIKGYAGIGADLFANFNPFVFGMTAAAKLEVDVEVGSIIGTTVEGYLRGDASFVFLTTSSSVSANANLDMSLGVFVEQCVPATGLCTTLIDGDVGCHAEIGLPGGFKFNFNKGYDTGKCPY